SLIPPSTFYPIDDEGHLRNFKEDYGWLTYLQEEILLDIVLVCQQLYGDQLCAVHFTDSHLYNHKYRFDFVVILNNGDLNERKLSSVLFNTFSWKYPFVFLYNSTMLSLDQIGQSRELQFLVCVLSRRVFGSVLHHRYKPFKPNKELIFLLKRLEKKFEEVTAEILIRKHHYETLKTHLVKFMMRASFELIIEVEQRFTRDIYLCQELFSVHYPQYSFQSRSLLSYLGTDVPDSVFIKSAENFKTILTYEYGKIK
ncbi:MAG TPA: hypothetical protein VFE57_01025, partial [Cyclobacteriaceae bacterium]|nr:hypothetical protein [Cyclobacteriaceae bacterium]